MTDTTDEYQRPAHVMVEQWQSDRACVEVVDSDGVIHTYHLRAKGDRLILSHTTEPVDASPEP